MKRITLLLLCVLFMGTGVFAQKIYLVAAGVSDYPGDKLDLRLPVNDATAIQWLYQKNKNAETVLLTNNQATKSNVLRNMENMFTKASPKDIVVFFFSGHGYPGGFVGYDEKIDYADIKKVMAKSNSLNKMIFADACISGKMRNQHSSTSSSTPSSLNVMLLLSSRSNEYSLESRSDKIKNGYFTAVLQRALRGAADKDRNRIITAKELFDYVSTRVKEVTNDEQHPVMWGKFSDSMPVMRW